MKFAIITPSFNQLQYLKRCLASVRDQVAPEGDVVDSSLLSVDKVFPATRQLINSSTQHAVSVHHHVQDGGSTDGTVEFLRDYTARQPATASYQLTFASEADEGMYDALNKGVAFALQKQVEGSVDEDLPGNRQLTTGNCDDEIVAWLNCDEQYLPGTFERVAQYFIEHSTMDMVYGDALFVDPNGRLLTYRKAPPLRRAYIMADHLYVPSAVMFFRSRIFRAGLRFNPEKKTTSDCDFIAAVLKSGFRCGQIKKYLSVFTMTGGNLGRQPIGVEELRISRRNAPPVYRLGRPVWNILRYLEKFMRGGYSQAVPLEYDLYLDESGSRRRISAESVSSRYKWGSDE